VIIVASSNGDVGIAAGIAILRHGGSAIDAVEAACRLVEDNVNDHSVGAGGYPNLLGEVELDASVMEGTTRTAGAVAALKDFPHPVSVARAVMERLPQHLLLAGQGARMFALEQGFETRNLLTLDAEQAFRDRNAVVSGESYSFAAERAAAMTDPGKTAGTVNFLAQDGSGRIASAVSTSGWAFKYPGRVGDSPIIGAGNYCDDRYGACACTGLGEWAIRASTARVVILMLQLGKSLMEACRAAFVDLAALPLPPSIDPTMNLIALGADGSHCGCSTVAGRQYIWQTNEMKTFETSDRIVFPEELI